MANTFDSDLIVKTIAAKAVTTLDQALAPLQVFSQDFSSEVATPKQVVNVPVVSAAGSCLKDASTFAVSETTKGNAQVTLSHYARPFGLTFAEQNEGHKLEQAAMKATQTVANKILLDTFANLTTGNYGAAAVTVATADAIDTDDLKTLWADLSAGDKGIVLSDLAYAQFNAVDENSLVGQSRYGFNSFNNTSLGSFASGATNLVGFACTPEAMAVASAVPYVHPALEGQIMARETITTDLGITLAVDIWGDPNTMSVYANVGTYYGSAVADGSAAGLIVTS